MIYEKGLSGWSAPFIIGIEVYTTYMDINMNVK